METSFTGTAQVPTNWARIVLYGGIAGVIGGIAGALMGGQNKLKTGLIGFAVLGGIGAFIGAKVYLPQDH